MNTKKERSEFKKFCIKLKRKVKTQSDKHFRFVRKLKQKHNTIDNSYDFHGYEDLFKEIIDYQVNLEKTYPNIGIVEKYLENNGKT